MIIEEFETSLGSSDKKTHTERFGLLVGYGFFFNTVAGAGFLSIPFAYQSGGWLLSLFLQIGVILVGLLFAYMTLETLSLVSSIDYLRQHKYVIQPIGFWKLFTNSDEPSSLIERKIPTPKLTQNQYDMAEMTQMLLGPKWGVFYLFSMSSMFFGGLIAYASIFGSSFASTVPLGGLDTCDVYNDFAFSGTCRWKYMIYVAIYSGFMIYFTCVGFKKQWWMQIMFTFMRLLILFLIITISAVAIDTKTHINDDTYNPVNLPVLANFSKLGTILGVFLFSSMYQCNMPNIVVHIKNKRVNIPRILLILTGTILTIYLLLGLLTAVAVPNVSSNAALSFRGYTGGSASQSGWTYIVAYIIVVYPALDVFSIFPIISITLADNFAALLFKQSTKKILSKWLALGISLSVIPVVILMVIANIMNYS